LTHLPNPHTHWRLSAALAALALLALPLARAQSASPQKAAALSGPYRIAGTVTDSVTGERVHHATVSLVEENSRETLQQVETDDDGRFSLDHLPQSKFGLMASRRGYLTAFFDEHDSYSSAIVTGPGQDTEHIPFRLAPGAMVHGVVTDDAGEPVENARVMLSMKSRNGGQGEHLMRPSSTNTDDTGAFELWDLPPGTYFLAVKAQPWFALHPALNGAGSSAGVANPLDVAYPVTYYDGTTDHAGAAPIRLAAGERAELNVPLHAAPAVHLMVRSGAENATPEQSRRIAFPALIQTILGEEDPASMGNIRPGPPGSGMVEVSGLAPGHYEIRQDDPPRKVEVDLSGNLEVDTSTGAQLAAVTAAVRMSDGAPVPEPLLLVLSSDTDASQEMQALVVTSAPGKSVARFGSVSPGIWTVMARSGELSLGVASLQTSTGVRNGATLHLKDHALSLTVTLVVGKTSVLGMVVKGATPSAAGTGENKGLAGVMVVLVPQDPGANRGLFRRDQSDSDGSFSLRDAAPGKYTVVAIEDGWELEWARPEVIRRYLSKGVGVTVPEHSDKQLQLAEPVPVQAR
jgi:5-hydroxyisourate hydrolase-like protein (transthyretin family)